MIGAIIGGLAAVTGGLMSSSATSKASKAASKAAAENAALQREMYNQTRSDLQPYTQGGYSGVNALLQYYGLGGQGGGAGGYIPPGGIPAGGPDMDGVSYVNANPDVLAAWNQPGIKEAWGGDLDAYGEAHYGSSGQSEGRDMPMTPGDPGTADPYQRPADTRVAPDFRSFYDPNPTQQYRDELAQVTRGVNAQAGMQGGYFSGNRGLALQDNAARLWRADEDRRFARANTLYSQALGQYNIDQARGDARFDTDRNFSVGRTDTRTNDLFKLAGLGVNAAGAQANAARNFANMGTQNNNALASAQGNAAMAGAGQVNGLLGNAMLTYGLFNGGRGGAGTGGNALSMIGPNGYNWGY